MTTDPQDELFEVLRPDGSPAGFRKDRGAVHRDGDWHRSLHIWVYGIDEHRGPFVLFQRRSMSKDTWPGALDVSVGGHIRAGETLEETVREAREEIGLPAAFSDLIRIGQRFSSHCGDGVFDQEVNEVFALRSDRPLCSYRLHPDEVDGLVLVTLADGIKLFRGAEATIPALEGRRAADHTASLYTDIRMQTTDFVDAGDGYAATALAAIRDLARGTVPEPFVISPYPKIGRGVRGEGFP